jgi:hypothetical protein
MLGPVAASSLDLLHRPTGVAKLEEKIHGAFGRRRQGFDSALDSSRLMPAQYCSHFDHSLIPLLKS